ncbi:hypothetical protein [Lysinibacillus endophyticus]|uniref:hypothetical protein n=1 Tax=Ureibacillus endophyticus TaxID=1978490 RepID=UPI0020A12624|nr:hypothetical protein [Lysinibacillus endophyticus]MCP1145790.1 hypothetical protein [Lysinibacillus endophyticus]
MNLLYLQRNKEKNVLEELREGNTYVLEDMNATEKLTYGLQLQQEVGIPNESRLDFEAVGEAYKQKLQQEKDDAEHSERIRKEHIEKVAKQKAEQIAAYRGY